MQGTGSRSSTASQSVDNPTEWMDDLIGSSSSLGSEALHDTQASVPNPTGTISSSKALRGTGNGPESLKKVTFLLTLSMYYFYTTVALQIFIILGSSGYTWILDPEYPKSKSTQSHDFSDNVASTSSSFEYVLFFKVFRYKFI